MTTTHQLTQATRKSALAAALLAAALLGSAIPAIAADTPAMAASNATTKAEEVISDSWITTKVKSEILAHSVAKAFKVGVKTKHGMVTLDGKLPNKDAVELVKMIAEKVKGVKGVDTSALLVGS